MKLFPRLRYAWLLLAGLVCIAFAYASEKWLADILTDIAFRKQVRLAQRLVVQKDTAATGLLEKLAAFSDQPSHETSTSLYHESERRKIFLYIIENGSVTYWTSNTTLPVINAGSPADASHFYLRKYPRGLFLQKNLLYRGRVLVALTPVQYTYSIQNRYLYPDVVIVDDEDRILTASDVPVENGTVVRGADKNFLFSLVRSGAVEPTWRVPFYLLGIVLLLLFVHFHIYTLLRKRKTGAAAGLLAPVLALFVLCWIVWQIPACLISGRLFSADDYASPVFSSLGDLLLTTCLVSYITWFAFLALRHTPVRLSRWLIFTVFSLLLAAAALAIAYIVRSLVLDSQLSLDLSNIFSLNTYSVIGLVVLFAWAAVIFILVRRYAAWLNSSFHSFENLWAPWGLITLVSGYVFYLLDPSFLLSLALVIAGTFITLVIGRRRQNAGPAGVIGYLVLSSLFLTILFSWYQREKETESKQVVARQLAIQRDNVAEYLFANIYRDIGRDHYLMNFYMNPVVARSFLEKRIRQLYFSGYLNKYDVVVSSYTASGMPFKMDYEQPLEYYREYLRNNTEEIRPGRLYFLASYTSLPGYIAIIPVRREGMTLGILLVRIQRKAFYEESIYPELFLSEDVEHEPREEYDYAVYRRSVLLTQNGDYAYPGVADFRFTRDDQGFGHFTADGFNHLVYRISDEITVVVSSRTEGLLPYFSHFSFLILFFALCGILFFALPYLALLFWRKKLWKYPVTVVLRSIWSRFSFRFKILATVTGGISLALFLIGIATIGYIVFQYNQDEIERLKRRTNFINSGLENAFEEADPSVPVGEEELTMILKRLSDLRRLDINVFGNDGNLVATTQAALFENQLVVPKMNAGAFHLFRDHHASQVLHEEQLGRLRFLASYRPIRNPLGDVVGYLNIPYFMQERELADRISNFLVALINLYLLLFVLLISLSIVMARALTEPLDLIRQHLRRTSLQANDTFLVWHNQDEIGKLVEEYNAALAALKESAARLSRSEREGAWKEIAQRVAHEISNPLTPMKLNLQRLQQAFAEDRDDIKPLFDKVTNLLIRQIDNLSELASNFGEYAKLPLGRPELIHPAVQVRNTAELFSGSGTEIEITIEHEEAVVNMDKNHWTQILNNLVKNAIQAIPEGRHGIVRLRLHADPNWVYMEVQDNGTGIPEEMQEKIFIPHFSTKSFGTGHGLAITREMIEFAGGHISFETRAGEGTTFSVRLPRWKGNPE